MIDIRMIDIIAVGIVLSLGFNLLIFLKVKDLKQDNDHLWTLSKLIHSDVGRVHVIVQNQEIDRIESQIKECKEKPQNIE